MLVEFGNLITALSNRDINGTIRATADIFDANRLTHEDCWEAHDESKKDLQDIKAGLIESGLTEESKFLRSVLDNQMDIFLDSGGYNPH